jgi:hypothetical protein
MRFESGKSYLAAFRKPWYVTLGMLQTWASELGIRIDGYWPRGHPNAGQLARIVGEKPYTHLIAATMTGPTRELELKPEITWVGAADLGPAQTFTVRRRTG